MLDFVQKIFGLNDFKYVNRVVLTSFKATGESAEWSVSLVILPMI